MPWPDLIAAVVCFGFLAIALWHFDMARRPQTGLSGAVPTVDGKPLFVPSRGQTVAVGVILLLFAGLVATTSGWVSVGLSQRWLVGLSYGLALGLLARSIGEFRAVGFFKSVRGTRFARLDSLVYSPVCLLLAIGVALVAFWNRAGNP